MPESFFLPADRVGFVASLEAAAAVIELESRSLAEGDFLSWPVPGAFTGDWRVLPVYCADPGWVLAPAVERNQPRFPRTLLALREIDGVLLAGFSWLAPGTHIQRHVDAIDAPTVRCHLGLRCPPGAVLAGCGERREWQRGRCIVFDGRVEHEAFNPGPTERLVLLVDVARRAVAGLDTTQESGSDVRDG